MPKDKSPKKSDASTPAKKSAADKPIPAKKSIAVKPKAAKNPATGKTNPAKSPTVGKSNPAKSDDSEWSSERRVAKAAKISRKSEKFRQSKADVPAGKSGGKAKSTSRSKFGSDSDFPSETSKGSYSDRPKSTPRSKSAPDRSDSSDSSKRSFTDRSKSPSRSKFSSDRDDSYDSSNRSYNDRSKSSPRSKHSSDRDDSFDYPKRSFTDRSKSPSRSKFSSDRDFSEDSPKRSFTDRPNSSPRSKSASDEYPRRDAYKTAPKKRNPATNESPDSPPKKIYEPETISAQEDSWRLNKYIANSGICSRREADTLISDGKVTVNGKVVTELGTKVSSKDRVKVDGSEVSPEGFVYILLNKPKGYITTTDDEKDRNTVMDLIQDATGLRVYPVGRLDRQTTGLLLLTNDGDLANRLMHPKYQVRKIYEVETATYMSDEHLNYLLNGIELEDGPAKAYNVKRVAGFPNVIQLSIFEGRNRQVRRMIEYFGNEVVKLNRKVYAGLSSTGVRQGRWRFLKPKEVNDLRMLVKLFDLKQK